VSHSSALARTAPLVLIALLIVAYIFAPHQAGAPLPLAGGAPAAVQPTIVSGLAAVVPGDSERSASIPGRTGRTGFAPTGPLVADLGFRPAPDGFSFQNYASNFPADPATLTIGGARTLFGDAVCAAVQLDGTCIASPLAEQWLAQMNLFLNTGRCEGLAALSQAIFLRRTTPSQLDPAAAATFELHRDIPAVSELVSVYAVTQFLEPVASATAASRSRTPAELLNELIATLQPAGDPPTLGMYEPSVGGHAVTPFAVEDAGNSLFRVWVYDNNFPGAAKYVEIDSAANTWRYAAAALNPTHDPAPWQGDANSHTLDLTPASARTARLVCPFCPPPAIDPGIPAQNDARAAPRQLVLSGDARLLAVDAQGRRLGFDGQQFLSEIPGAARLTWRSNADGSEAAIYSVPNGIDLTVQLNGRDGPASERFAMFSPGGVLAIGEMQLAAGRADVLHLAGDGRISYAPGGTASPRIDLAVDGDGAQYAYTVERLNLQPGANLVFSVDPSGKLDVSSDGAGSVENVSVRRIPETAP
jgi:hypothetical protein